jgi:hypothetical protein
MKNKTEMEIIAEIFGIIIGICDKVKNIRDKLDPQICQIIATQIKEYYLNSNLDQQALMKSYNLFVAISKLLDLPPKQITTEKLEEIIQDTKKYLFSIKNDMKTLKKIFKLYNDLEQDLNKNLKSPQSGWC